MTEQPTVRPGQVWADNDKRSAGRRVLVLAITGDGQRAEVVRCLANGQRTGSRTTYIRIDRFRPTSTGYRLLADAAPVDTTPSRPHRDEPALDRHVTTVHLPAADIA